MARGTILENTQVQYLHLKGSRNRAGAEGAGVYRRGF